MGNKVSKYFIIGAFVSLYIIVSLISTIHSIEFFGLSNPHWLAVSLAIAFEVGAAASLASLVTLEKMNKTIVWTLFFVLTAMQCMSNAYYAYSHLHDFQNWVELFGLVDSEVIEQKRILSIISGAILPLVALGFIKSLVDYMRPTPEGDYIQNQDIPQSANFHIEGEGTIEGEDLKKVFPKYVAGADPVKEDPELNIMKVTENEAGELVGEAAQPEKRVFKIDINPETQNMSKEEIDAYVEKIANSFKRKPLVNPETGEISPDAPKDFMKIDQDIFIPASIDAEKELAEILTQEIKKIEAEDPELQARNQKLQKQMAEALKDEPTLTEEQREKLTEIAAAPVEEIKAEEPKEEVKQPEPVIEEPKAEVKELPKALDKIRVFKTHGH